jgi:8-oxo-dGTP diphosphatase
MEAFAISVKAFIVDKGKLFVAKRIPNEVHYAGKWDIPGGRLAVGENPFDGLKRETKEETGLEIEIMMPIQVDHFIRDDGQKITMIIFLCKPLTTAVTLSKAHTEYKWMGVKDTGQLQDWLVPIAKTLTKYDLYKFVSEPPINPSSAP